MDQIVKVLVLKHCLYISRKIIYIFRVIYDENVK